MRKLFSIRRLIFVLAILICFDNVSAQDSISVRSRLRNVNWGRLGVSLATRITINSGVVYLLKHSVREWRPDYSDDNSFPSRHAAFAFSAAATLSYRFGEYSPLWVLGSQAVASGVGFQRVMGRHHYPGDVLAGAGIGLSSAVISNVLGDCIFGKGDSYRYIGKIRGDVLPYISVETGSVIPLNCNAGGVTIGTALSASAIGALPMGDVCSAVVHLTMRSAPLKQSGRFVAPLNSLGVLAGVQAQKPLGDGPFNIDGGLLLGYIRNLDVDDIKVSSGGAVGQVRSGLSVMFTQKLSLGISAGYEISRMGFNGSYHAGHSIVWGISSRAFF